MAARGPKIPRAPFSDKKNVLLFLNFIGPLTPHGFCIPLKPCIWATRNLYWPEQCLQSKLKCLDGSQGPQNSGSTIFRKKKKNVIFFLKFIEPVTPLWVLYPSEIIPVCAREPPLARAVLARSIKMLGWQPGAPKSREHDFPKKKPHDLLKFIGSATPL